MHHIPKPTIPHSPVGYAEARYFYEAVLMVLHETEPNIWCMHITDE